MGYGSISGRAITNPDAPRAFAVCDRCGMWYNHDQLQWQYDYRGRMLQNIRILVCEECLDDPQPQLKPRLLPPDPLPIANARIEPFCYDEENQRFTTNPALTNVDLATVVDIQLAGLQFVDGIQTTDGDLVLVKNQMNQAKNGIYRVNAGLWTLMGFDNDTNTYYPAESRGVFYYGQLGYFMGAVNVSRGRSQYGKLFQIQFEDPNALLSVGTKVWAYYANPSLVDHYDFYTGIFMVGGDLRVTMTEQPRVTQEVGQASGNINEIPGFSDLVPGSCDIGIPDAVPYGCGTRQGLPPGMDTLPFSGALWPSLANQSIGHWLNDKAKPTQWINNFLVELTFKSVGFWPNPGPGVAAQPMAFDADLHRWVNNYTQTDFWNNNLDQNVDWRNGAIYGVYPPGGNTLWVDEKCVIVLWHNNSRQNVNFAEIYPNGLPPNKPGPWPFGWMT